jgi:hypothetical protein
MAVVVAGATNVALSRMPEMKQGVQVMDKEGTVRGISQAAAIESVKFTVLSRNVFLPIIPMLAPSIIMGALGLLEDKATRFAIRLLQAVTTTK